MLKEMEIFFKNCERSMLYSVVITTVKTGLFIAFMTPNSLLKVLGISFNILKIYRQNDISSVFTLAVVTSYHLHLHIKMTASLGDLEKEIFKMTKWPKRLFVEQTEERSVIAKQLVTMFFQ